MNSLDIFARKLVNDLDPMGLIKGGAPDNEYDAEINALVRRTSNVTHENEIEKILEDIFRKDKFGVEINHAALKAIAEKLSVYINSGSVGKP